jgi:DNA-binding SARP family transcriptional activator/TolB-like protein
MIQLRLLGALDIEFDDGDDQRSLVAHPKRIALLAYLAVQGSHSAVPRDALLGVFWAESDGRRARGALRNALHFLRSRLGPSALYSEGDRIRLDGLWCDAAAFEDLLERGELEEALELYRGDLLEGFFLSDTPEFEAWLEEERGRLRRRAVDACWSLVDEADRSGRVALAARYARRALGLSPTDEIGARRLLALLARAGDVTGALRAHEEFVERLDRLYEIQPSEETDRLVAAIRRGELRPDVGEPMRSEQAARPAVPEGEYAAAGDDAERSDRHILAEPTAMAPSGAPPAGADPLARRADDTPGHLAPQPSARSPRRVPLPLWFAAAAALAVIAVAGTRDLGGRDAPAEPPLGSAPVLAVLPFHYEGSDALAFLGDGLARLVSDALNGAGDLRTVDRRAIGSFVQQRGGADETTIALAAARRFGARYYAVGDVMEQDSMLHVTVTLRHVDADRGSVGHTAMAEARAADVFALADRLTRQLLDGMGHEGIERSALRTGSPLAALKAFLRGETAAGAGWFREAMEEFGTAVREDSTFALAHYGLSAAAYNAGVADVPRRAAEAARRHSAGLPRSDQVFLEAWRNHLDARIPEAETFYRQAIALQPTHVDGWHQLGELLFHWGPAMGTAPAAALRPFEQVLALEPGDAGASLHVARLAARTGDRERVRSLAESAGAGATAAWILEMEALDAFLSDDARLVDAAIEGVAAARDRVGVSILASVAANTGNMAASARLARELLAPGRGSMERAVARALLVRIEFARGRLGVARREADQSPELPEATRRELSAAMELLPFHRPDSARHERIAALLADGSLDAGLPPQTDAVWMGAAAYPPLRWGATTRAHRLFLAGLCQARAGATQRALDTAASLEGLTADPETATYPGLIRATVALGAGDATGALAALGPPGHPPGERLEGLRDYARPLDRWLRAEALAGSGRLREALRWFATFPGERGVDLWYAPYASLRRAEIHERLGEPEAARSLYRDFLDSVRGAEPYVRDDVRRATAGLYRVGGTSAP